MSDQPQQPAEATQPETLYVENIDQFIALLFAWHENKVKTMEHMLTIPEGTEVSFSDEAPTALSGDVYKGFQIGLSLALLEFGTLPFMAEPAPDAANDAAPTTSDESTQTH